LVNGAYGRRMAKILEILDRPHRVEETEEDTPPDPDRLDAILERLGDAALHVGDPSVDFHTFRAKTPLGQQGVNFLLPRQK